MNTDKPQAKSSSLAKSVKVVLTFIFLWQGFLWYVNSTDLPSVATFSFEEHTTSLGYPFLNYSVVTQDGYILSVYRIPGKTWNSSRNPPVLLIHGLSNSAHCFILNQCSTAPAFKLAEEGYDVWLGNLRGNHLSRQHLNLTEEQEEYWDWSFPEVIHNDLPAFVKFVKSETGYEKIVMLGHSMGGAAVLWMLAEAPEMAEDVALGVAVGSPGGVILSGSYYLNFLSLSLVQNFWKFLGVRVISDWTDDLFLAKFVHTFQGLSSLIAKDLYDMELVGGKSKYLSTYLHRIRGGTSLQNLVFWSQVKANKLANPKLYDYGTQTNLEKYGTEEPPVVDFKKIRTKVAVFNGKYDKAVPKESSEVLKNSLPQEYLVHYSDEYLQDHAGFLFSCKMDYFEDLLKVVSNALPNNN